MTDTPDDQLPLAVPTSWTPTGDVRVDSAVELVADLSDLPLADHPEVYEDVHRRLQQALADATGN